MKQRIFTLLKVSVTLLGLAIVFSQVHFRQIGNVLVQVNLGWLLGGFLLVLLSLVVRAYRWLLLLRGLGVSVTLRRLVQLYFVGNFFTIALPSGFGGDVIRTVEIAREVEADVAAGTVILDRLTGLIMLFWMALLVLPFHLPYFPAAMGWFILAGAVGGGVAFFLLLNGGWVRPFLPYLPAWLSPVQGGFIGRLWRAVRACGGVAVGQASAVSLLFNLMLAGWWYTNGLALGLRLPFSYYVLVMPILSLPLLLPSIGGLGPPELIAPALFGVMGVSAETAVSLSLLNFILQRASGLLGAPVYLLSLLRLPDEKRP